ncbi:MAG: hypothetical protein JST58_09825 [Bacteroidetes bacterium]|nr:hypothetical protein [Bacteroidota bacterium]
MRILLVLIVCSIAYGSFAQELDFTDFRRKNEGFSHITNKSMRNDLASFTLGGLDESIGKGQLKKMPVTSYGNDFITFDSNQIKVIIKTGPFFATKHKMIKEGDHVVKIDNKPYFGNYGKIPSVGIYSLTVIVDKDTVPIPANAIANLYNPQLTYFEGGVMKTKCAVYLSPDKHSFYIYMLNMDNMGGYEVTWVIQDKQFVRRVIDYGFIQ